MIAHFQSDLYGNCHLCVYLTSLLSLIMSLDLSVALFFYLLPLSGSWLFSVSELAAPGAEVGRISATDADLGENAKLEYTILEGESGDTFSITGVNQEAIITLTKVRWN